MSFDFKLAVQASLRHLLSLGFWLQAGACAIVAWSLLHGGLRESVPAAGAAPAGSPAADAGTPPATAPAQDGHPAEAAAPAAAEATLPLSSIDVTVSRNDTLDRIFRRLKLNLADLASLRGLPGIRRTLDSLRPGESMHVTHHNGDLYGLEWRVSETQTLKVSREGTALRADVLQNPVELRSRTIRGTIDSSLFEAVEAAGAHDQTAVQLADIFGWDIDFVLDVRTGDTFAVTYGEVWRDGKYLHDGPIQAAEFVNQGRTFRAVRYTGPDGHSQYYTPEGRSLHKAFLRAPVEFTRVSSRFNSARYHPILNLIRAHKGVDYAAPTGTPVHAAGDGRIVYAGSLGGYGNCVEIEHSRSIVTLYGHLSRFARGTHVGAHVTQGAVIAYVGMTGLATGPHLHYEYRVNGVFKNPQTVALPAAAPIDPRWREDFLGRSAALLASLEAPPGPMLVSR
ncbi:MAG: peptidoglycan DD-metalloendopeptidase family protein [Gammaproteobacteria bacterium]|nr:peptidoglycan DD-metalloendopeptidase family protein [Gammaproteobacteria bacterium]MBV8403260.1 peptidoglycan DD-metalloendopeptidase family protein [Gammaproteobacteria bacterium]